MSSTEHHESLVSDCWIAFAMETLNWMTLVNQGIAV